ncbi:MAG: hypothetical protein COV34_02865 [Candidatus Zambryskibacteria bacterium CG10_big_fil_rev_8_21_14_0_10_42_12]|uniref:AAA+ ATPase domain-containing protein n=1 Tax=Candidatus Zambryskibacteria bacterium CG10_big_fil_rev_8_21_14_0_10_42_12 TaxID=1975115 RepID=A0A2H0QW11_9BACT|nr:MAG: hypothetical protein COV34_02865 [Candidatus Zambryskibacteria bacterium CG10_big_fil_rev_8_21_14_0_10_42_12]
MTQQEALDILKTGQSVFLTGAAGSGKTHVLRNYIHYLKEKGVSVGVTASTGIAATHLSGMTIHAWSGIGIKDYLSPHDLEVLRDRSQLRNRFQNTDVLVVDEVSMLHHFRLDLVDQVARTLRDNDNPFGGMQVIFSGDFFQLPPVSRAGEEPARFAYCSDAWQVLNPAVCYLEEQYRQNDDEYLSVLNAIRDNAVDVYHQELLQGRLNKKPDIGMEPTVLHSHNANVDVQNDRELNNISGKVFEYKMYTRGPKPLVEALVKSCLAPELLKLKVGARVMFVKNNFDLGYVNGTLGIVEELLYDTIKVRTVDGTLINVPQDTWQIEDDGKVKAEISQYPLRLAWAITIHKSQGMSLDAAHIDLSRSFEPGMGYVALSRVKTLGGLTLAGINRQAFMVHPEVLEQDMKFKELSGKWVRDIRVAEPKALKRSHDDFLQRVKKVGSSQKIDTVTQTYELVALGKNSKDIAKERGLKRDTILSHIEKIKEQDPFIDLDHIRKEISTTKFVKIRNEFIKQGVQAGGERPLGPIKNKLGSGFSYDDLKLVRIFL